MPKFIVYYYVFKSLTPNGNKYWYHENTTVNANSSKEAKNKVIKSQLKIALKRLHHSGSTAIQQSILESANKAELNIQVSYAIVAINSKMNKTSENRILGKLKK